MSKPKSRKLGKSLQNSQNLVDKLTTEPRFIAPDSHAMVLLILPASNSIDKILLLYKFFSLKAVNTCIYSKILQPSQS